MENVTRIAVIGDFDENKISHRATSDALGHAADLLPFEIEVQWFSTGSFEKKSNLQKLAVFDGIWGAPGVPESTPGFINAVQVAREIAIPYLGT